MKKLLIFIVAYKAESTIARVLSRIPSQIHGLETEILVIDDASDDRTVEAGLDLVKQKKIPYPVTILKNPVNQGYGGNQKLGFLYAIEHGFDIVALIHGDGQYAPECLPDLLKPLVEGDAEAVFGSRMITALGALKGGMPLYKYFGNKILTTFQNWALSSKLSEFHSGYRLYSVAALKRIPFELNSNVFHFDTEIIIQLIFAGLRIKELPIPTYYGDEICRVNGMKYAWDVVRATGAAMLQKFNIIYRRNFDVGWNAGGSANFHYEGKLDFVSSHTMALKEIGKGETVVDIGCGPGFFQKPLKDRECRLIGVDIAAPSVHLFDEFYQIDLNDHPLPPALKEADWVLLLDIIEHLKSPETFLRKLSEVTEGNPRLRIVITTPNIAFGVIRLMLLLGMFNYGKKGILDMTHTRLFTFGSLSRLLTQYGFVIEKTTGVPPPYPLVVRSRFVSHLFLKIHEWMITLWKEFFSYQICVVCRPLPSVRTLLEKTMQNSTENSRRGE